MATEDSVALKNEHSSSAIDKKSAHLTEGSNLTPLFDREDHLKEPDASFNEASSSEESDYNQASVIFSLDELQTSLTGLRVSVSPDVAAIEQHKNSAGLLFPSLIQDENEQISVSSKEELEDSDQNDEFVTSSTSSPLGDVLKSSDETNEIAKHLTEKDNAANIEVQPNDSLLCHIDSSLENTQSSVITEHSSVIDVTNNYLEDDKLTAIDTLYVDTSPQVETPQIETPHVEPSSNDATITQSSPVDTPTAISRSLSGVDLLGDTKLSNSVCSDNIAIHHERSTDSISMTGSTVSKTLSEKLKPTQNTFESPGLLYAHPVKKSSKKITETLEPAEAATEALQGEEDLLTTQKESRHIRAKADKRGELFIGQTHLPSFNYKNPTGKVVCTLMCCFSECDSIKMLTCSQCGYLSEGVTLKCRLPNSSDY